MLQLSVLTLCITIAPLRVLCRYVASFIELSKATVSILHVKRSHWFSSFSKFHAWFLSVTKVAPIF